MDNKHTKRVLTLERRLIVMLSFLPCILYISCIFARLINTQTTHVFYILSVLADTWNNLQHKIGFFHIIRKNIFTIQLLLSGIICFIFMEWFNLSIIQSSLMSVRPSVRLKLKISVTTEPIGFYSPGNISTGPVVVLSYFLWG